MPTNIRFLKKKSQIGLIFRYVQHKSTQNEKKYQSTLKNNSNCVSKRTKSKQFEKSALVWFILHLFLIQLNAKISIFRFLILLRNEKGFVNAL